MTTPNNKPSQGSTHQQTNQGNSPGRDASGPGRAGDPQQPTPRTPGADPARNPQAQGAAQGRGAQTQQSGQRGQAGGGGQGTPQWEGQNAPTKDRAQGKMSEDIGDDEDAAESKRMQDKRVDDANKQSFPASDPASSHQSTGADDEDDEASDTKPL